MVGGAVSSRERGPLLGTLPLPHSVLARLFEHGAAPRAQIFVLSLRRTRNTANGFQITRNCTLYGTSCTHVPNSELTDLRLRCLLESDEEDGSFSKPAWVVIVC